MAEVGAADLDEDQPEPVGHVLHERRLAVAGRRDEQQQALRVGAPAGVGGAELFGEAVADQREVHLVEQPVADEGGHDPRPVVVHPQPGALGGDQRGALPLVGAEAGDGEGAELLGPCQEFIDP